MEINLEDLVDDFLAMEAEAKKLPVRVEIGQKQYRALKSNPFLVNAAEPHHETLMGLPVVVVDEEDRLELIYPDKD